MRGSPSRNSEPSTLTVILLMLLAMGVVFEHAVNTDLATLVLEAALFVVLLALVMLASVYHGNLGVSR